MASITTTGKRVVVSASGFKTEERMIFHQREIPKYKWQKRKTWGMNIISVAKSKTGFRPRASDIPPKRPLVKMIRK